MTASILVVEDDRAARDYLRLLLEQNGYEVRPVTNGLEALLALEHQPSDLVVSDVRMPQMDGMELLTRVSQRWPELPVILITADTDLSQMSEAVRMGAINYIVKPASAPAVVEAVKRALTPRPTLTLANRSLPELVGSSRAMVEVRHLVSLAARADVSVLLTGEPGTGKHLAATTLHRYSCLSEGPFVRYDCAEASGDAFEGDFFGRQGADRSRAGLLSRANGGFLYLEHIDALDIDHQFRFLQAIQECEARPVGADEGERFSVRVVASTRDDPRALIADDALREDLYYRLRGFEIHVPTLRERSDDIPALVEHFLGDVFRGIDLEAVDLLSQAHWPENVRQLADVVEQARKVAGDASIGVSHLPTEALSAAGLAGGGTGDPEPLVPPNTTLRDLERRAIIQALKDCMGNRSKAARMLGIDRSTLRRKIVEFGIEDV